MESLTSENHQLKEYNKDITNQLATAYEELEVMAAHLDETGRDLDMANTTVTGEEGGRGGGYERVVGEVRREWVLLPRRG